MTRGVRRLAGGRIGLAWRALKAWKLGQFRVAAFVAAGFALLVGVATVLIPNPWFSREIATVWWNYPVWIVTAVLVGLLTATYMRAPAAAGDQATGPGGASERRTTRMGVAGGVLTWFAVGCPVCNKIALLALGYSGAITWFAPLQPVLATAALVLTGVALVWRLSGQVACPLPSRPKRTQVVREAA